MNASPLSRLSRRERQIIEILFERGEASAAEVRAALPDPPSYSSVRTLLSILERKGHLRHRREGGRYIFRPIQPREQAGRAALRNILKSFYRGSLEQAVTALLDTAETPLSEARIARLEALIRQRRKEGR